MANRFRRSGTLPSQTIASIFFIDGSAAIAGYYFSGFYNLDMLLMVIAALPLMMTGLHIGGHIHTTVTQRHFQPAIGVLLMALLW